MTISENPEIFPPNTNVKLPAKDIELIKTFVRNNFKLLSKLADQEISFLEFAKQMKI
jgi:hypothetical protein